MDPFTGMLIMGGLNAGLGAMKSSQNRRQRKMEAEARAAEIEASPWTGRGATTQVSTPNSSVWADMLGGAVSGIGQAQSLQNAGLFTSSEPMGVVAPQELAPQQFFNQTTPQTLNWNRMIPRQPSLYGRMGE
jgi:hypothetical protein